MPTVNGTINIGGGIPPTGAWGEVAAVAPAFIDNGDFVLPYPETITIATDGTWSKDLVLLPDGYAWVFRFTLGGGVYENQRTVLVPAGTWEYGELIDAEDPAYPQFGAPAWVALQQAAGAALVGEAEDARDIALAAAAEATAPTEEMVADAVAPIQSELDALELSLPNTYVTLAAAAKNPDLLIAGAVTGDPITSAAVIWPDGTPGVMTITARHSTGAVNAYNITYGSPVTKTFTQPTITRATSGVPTNVPAIVVT